MPERRSNRRQIQAEATRRDILAAARRLFAAQGYAATSMAAIAEEAGAAMQTVYSSVGPKHAILLALLDLLDEEAGVGAMWRKVGETHDQVELVRLGVNLTRQFVERFGDILWTMMAAASIEPDVAAALEEGNRRHRTGMRRLAGRIAETGSLKAGLTPERAGDIFGLLTWAATYRQMIDDFGWTLDEAEAWIAETLITLLLPTPGK